MKTLNELFMNELADIYDAERQIIKALPKMAKAATSPLLQKAFLSHLEETKSHVTKVEKVFECFNKKAKRKPCEATKGLLKEGDEIAEEFKDSPALNAALISSVQKVEHYEMASYGCLQEWAVVLGNQEAADILETILEEEKTANQSLTKLARKQINEEAMSTSNKD